MFTILNLILKSKAGGINLGLGLDSSAQFSISKSLADCDSLEFDFPPHRLAAIKSSSLSLDESSGEIFFECIL